MNDRTDTDDDRTDDDRGDDHTGYPTVPQDRLRAGGWELWSKSERTVFRLPTVSVIGYTLVYVDARLQDAVEAAGAGDVLAQASGDGDRLVETEEDPWRFFFATALSFRPPLTAGIGSASLLPLVTAQARRAFVADLEARGFEAIDRERTQRVRVESGARGRLSRFTARLPLESADAPTRIDVEGWLAVWMTDGSFRIAGGAYPIFGMDALLSALPASERPRTDPGAFREEVLELIRSVR